MWPQISLTESRAPNKIISRLNNGILWPKKDKKEDNLTIPGAQMYNTVGDMRVFITSVHKRYQGTGGTCWRCGGDGADHFHIFWDCQAIF